jgi:predicted HicB family RNase H-like nuclease
MSESEKLPVDESITVIEYKTIYKTKKWWKAVVLVNAWGHDKVMVYLWQWKEKKKLDNGKWIGSGQFSWRVQQKMSENFAENWEEEKKAIDEFMLKIRAAKA